MQVNILDNCSQLLKNITEILTREANNNDRQIGF